MGLTSNHLRHAIRAIQKDVDAMGDLLNELDAKLGDGDLGVTMVNGFNNMAAIADDLPDDFGRACMEAAKAMTKVSGSSFGTLMGISLMAVAKQTKGEDTIPWSRLSDLIGTAIDAMMERGGASLGDKTILDSLEAIRRACTELDRPDTVLSASVEAATDALYSFRDKPNRIGRARIFGDKTIGMDDPGMVAIQKMLQAL
ncbi:dihydroxyacetone kinase subunit L [Octadecabacter sp. 1_MG-2023]|uniref:dihydroxyacetone kinase subunit L n=1 Tax=unclassified Octadecabacter TaxID=196158 RepID=UPI001C0A4BBB|nr:MULTISPECIES: dihydroxyacetone kinase subunit L [unclassified Octadecabacter]MBU2991870.1 dihydroxyacetone kinase subunit L [Octadecabacter sp. B2R22]MDO6735844.1 dihydroxyacetone kinase subunit L [Octadecabacter sp. 1_MG-2023]